jgi:hypothetical protein
MQLTGLRSSILKCSEISEVHMALLLSNDKCVNGIAISDLLIAYKGSNGLLSGVPLKLYLCISRYFAKLSC